MYGRHYYLISGGALRETDNRTETGAIPLKQTSVRARGRQLSGTRASYSLRPELLVAKMNVSILVLDTTAWYLFLMGILQSQKKHN